MAKKRFRVLISGIVQGVFFRDTTKKKADELGIFGYVKNLNDGKVEAVFEGKEKDINKIIDYCKEGPKGAVVKNIDLKEEEYKGEFNDFRILK